ncbi:MAG: hypothetical protein AB8G96_12885 [Phycisphaerales bacterium]
MPDGPTDTSATDLDPLLARWITMSPRRCPRCQYDLTGLRHPVCAECGESIALQVTADASVSSALIAGMLGIGGPLGFTLMLALGSILFELRRGRGLSIDDEVGTVLRASGALVVLLVLWLVCRRLLLRLPRWAAWAIALGIGALSMYIAFGFMRR